ncbi:putative monooxygenase [Peziza echinospora]|nr:putative monooxygenase [Peziza echinospora]
MAQKVIIIGAGMLHRPPQRISHLTHIRHTANDRKGLHGIIAARTYLQSSPTVELSIIEGGNTVGGVWSDERLYPELYAQVTHKYFEFSQLPMKEELLSPDNYISGLAVNKYLNEFAEKFDIMRRIRFNTWVRNVCESAHGGWDVTVRYLGPAGEVEETLHCHKLIVAAGTANTPEIPNIPRRAFTAPVEHSQNMSKFVAALESPFVRRVTVVGAAKAAYDAVYLAMRAGKQVDWLIRPDGRGPLSVYPSRMFGIKSMDIGFTRLFSSFSPSVDSSPDWWAHFLHRTTLGRLLTRLFWWVVTVICNYYAGYSRSENAGRLRPQPNSVFWCNAGCGLISNPKMWELFHSSNLATVHRRNIVAFESGQVILDGGADSTSKIALPSDFVLLCTGWRDELHKSMFGPADWTRLGLPYFDESDSIFESVWGLHERKAESAIDKLFPILANPPALATPITPNRNVWRQYRRMVPPSLAAKGENSIVFLGQIYLMQTMFHAEVQALWAVAYLLGNIAVPEIDDMRKEIAQWNVWTRKRYLHRGNTMPYAIYDQIACCDRLLGDLGVSTKRRSNWFSEHFLPRGPRHYTGMFDEYQSALLKQTQTKTKPNDSPI